MTFYNQHSTALVGAAGQPEGYTIERSLRFRSSASAYLNRTPSTTTNRKTWTWSGWVKRAKPGSNGLIFAARTGAGATYTTLVFSSVDDLRMESNTETAYPLYKTSALFRDPSAWYHIVVALDTTQATSTNRLKIYVNGVLQTAASYNVPAQNTDLAVNSTETHLIGQQASGSYFDGYLTEVNFIDGQALDPSYFGETDTDTGAWKAKAYTGSYGTNGFYLNFSNNSSTTTLGYDQSSNSNNWTLNNFSLTAGSTYDSMQDVPTLTSASAGNYATLNPLDKNGITLEQANLLAQSSGATWKSTRSTMGMSSGKWYCEFEGAGGNLPFDCMIGVGSSDLNIASYGAWNTAPNSVIYSAGDGSKWLNGLNSSYGSSYTIGDIIGVAFDADARTVTFYKNNVSQGQISTGWSAGTFSFEISLYGRGGGTTSAWFNAGQRPFAYTPPTGYKALNTYNLPTPTIKDGSDYFNTLLWTGDGTSSRNITGLAFQPDFSWLKSRSQARNHTLFDAVRTAGSNKALSSSTTDPEGLGSTAGASASFGYVSGFNSDGFSVSAGTTNAAYVNIASETYVAWNWKANGSGVSNTDGSITSTVSANTSSGFSIVTYTGNGVGGATVGHGLGIAPRMIIVKNRSGVYQWLIQHASVGPNYYFHFLTDAAVANVVAWNNTAPTSSVFSIGSSSLVNTNGQNCVAYCFAPIEGYSAFGSYTGNGSTDGPFVYTGFRPAFVLFKVSSTSDSWIIHDATRDPYNVASKNLYPNGAFAEDSNTTNRASDFLSNGFKIRSGSYVGMNQSGATYIYAAFAENPFKYSLAR